MQVTIESIKQEIDQFNDEQLKEIAKFIELIKIRTRSQKSVTDMNQFATLYQEFATDDRELAEVGMADYANQLQQEDKFEINRMGYEALMNALGFDGTIIFLRQFDPGKGDYTTERHQRLNKITLEEIFT